jgi:osmotically-inducible protein OsmY
VYAQSPEIKDSEISFAIQDSLLADEIVAAHLIDVETRDGIVTFSGSVDHLLARDQAIRIAEGIKGVRAVIDQLRVIPVVRPDDELRKDVKQALLVDPATDLYEIDVVVNAGVVILDGTVESWAERQLAAQVVKGVKGVKEVRNNLFINYSEERLDSEIKLEIERRLNLDPYVDEALIDVKVENGKVILTGTIGSVAEKTQVYVDAWVTGVQEVDDSGLKIEWWARDEMRREQAASIKSDNEIQQAVKDTFRYDPRVSSFDVTAIVIDGRVTLTGTVDNFKARKAAEQDAKNTIGVWSVKNYILVRPVNSPTDAEIAENVRESLRRDILVDRYDITVSVLNNKVYLYGTVDSYYQKWRAEDVASRVNGVVDVQNSLSVKFEWSWKSDQAIKENIESEYFWSLLVDGDDITINVDHGVATLTGTVDDWSEYDAAIDNAFEAGAKAVQSYLEIKEVPGDHSAYYNHRYFR